MRAWALVALLTLVAPAGAPQSLPGTTPLVLEGDLASRMLDGIDRFLDRRTRQAPQRRERYWIRDFSSGAAYERSVAPNRERFRGITGLVYARAPFDAPVAGVIPGRTSVLAKGARYRILAVRWPVLEGVDAEGLLLQPDSPPVARVIALPDADWSPEMLAGLEPGIPAESQFARRLAENGCLVLVPTLIDRGSQYSGNPRFNRSTNMPHREFLYRMSYFVGRHIIGYEVQKVLAAVDWFSRGSGPIGVIGYGEGGLLALYSAAADPRIGAAAVSGYFQARQNLWSEPIYRNVWGLLEEFGDAELAGLVAPRTLVVEASEFPPVATVEPGDKQRKQASPQRLTTPRVEEVRGEVDRARPVFERLGAAKRLAIVETRAPGSDATLSAFLGGMVASRRPLRVSGSAPELSAPWSGRDARLRRQFDQIVRHTQDLVRNAEFERARFWAKADRTSADTWRQTTNWYRSYFWDEITGRLPDPTEPLSASTRRIYDEPKWTAYEVVLPAWPDVFAYGILLVPKDLRPGERRPVVVCQHGLEGRPQHVVMSPTKEAEYFYHRYAARLADRGFIVYAPQNPYLFGDRFRQLQRKANPLKLSLFSFVLGQYQRVLDWLESLPFVDPQRIGFYGLSYGGVTAVRVPPILGRFALAICSANFNEWVWINVLYDTPHTSYLYDRQYEMSEFNYANTFNYAELAGLMAPKPFMVERGHFDTVAPDEWVSYEYAKLQRHYMLLKAADSVRIEFFEGPHSIHGAGTFAFLHKYLNWPEPKP